MNSLEKKVDEIKVLGAYGSKFKNCGTSSFYLNEKNVIDAGNLVIQLEEKSANIQNIWITHSHLDHISDIAYIVDNYYSYIKKTINIYALAETIQAIKEHFFNDIIWPDFSKIKLLNGSGMCINYIEIELNKKYLLSDTESITPFKTNHTVVSCGYIYKKEETAILITADTYLENNIIDMLNNDISIKSAIIECSFPSNMLSLAKKSKHLTPKLLSKMLENLKRDDLQIYINHMKPLYLEEITKELACYCAKWEPKILKDGEIIKF